jgi:ATP-dependent DNA helicase PIF1
MSVTQKGSGQNYDKSDYETLLERRIQLITKDPNELTKFKDAPIVVGEKVLHDALNNAIVQNYADKTDPTLHWYHSDDKYRNAPLKSMLCKRMLRVGSNISNDALGMVPGMKVMITDNVAMWGGVANGCQGVLKDIKYETNDFGERRAICAYVHVPGCKINAPGLAMDIIPILPERTSFKYSIAGGSEFYISRLQLSLVPAYAFTANKIQGQSLRHALVDLKSARGTQALYVMISRAVSLDNLAILCWFPSTNLNRHLSQAYRDEFKRLELLDNRTTDEFNKRKWKPTPLRVPLNVTI